MERYSVKVDRIVFSNSENGYCVLRVKSVEGQEMTVTGTFPVVSVGSCFSIGGEWVMSKYGRQFKVSSVMENVPTTEQGIIGYLTSGLVKGIGPVYAARIVEKFGRDTLNVLDNDISRIREVEGIGKTRYALIRDSWKEHKAVRDIIVFLSGIGLPTGLAVRIYREYGDRSVEKVRENPYALAEDIFGVGFLTADRVALGMGVARDDVKRLEAGVMHVLREAAQQEGHLYLTWEQICDRAGEILGAGSEGLKDAMSGLLRDSRVVMDKDVFYLPRLFGAETGAVSSLVNLLFCADALWDLDERKPVMLPDFSGSHYEKEQQDAIRLATVSDVSVITGGPGTGKTTTVKGIMAAYEGSGLKVLLAAPTGRAAKRMSEASGREAVTIHRLLEFTPKGGWGRNVSRPLEGDLLIVDECSMIDMMLFDSLLKAVPRGMRVVLVGDVDQLPSVGAGCVLRDVIDSGAVPVTRLRRIHRQGSRSEIVTAAHDINSGRTPDTRTDPDSEYVFLRAEDPEMQRQLVIDCATCGHPAVGSFLPYEVQVLTPMRRGPLGTVALNGDLQSMLNPEGTSLVHGMTVFRVGDRVMQTRNDYDREVFNGDCGTVASVDVKAGELKVDFDGREVSYPRGDLDGLVLSYACTIHKSQGSEYPVVVIPVSMSHYVMLQRNLLYTGVTRARAKCVLVGSEKALAMCVRTMSTARRNTFLRERLEREARDRR